MFHGLFSLDLSLYALIVWMAFNINLYIVLNLNGRMNLLKLLPQPNQTAVGGKMRQSRLIAATPRYINAGFEWLNSAPIVN